MHVCPLDKQFDVAIKIIKLIESEKVTFSEYGFINTIVNDIVNCQEEDLKFPDLYHYRNKIEAVDPSNIIIKYEGVVKP